MTESEEKELKGDFPQLETGELINPFGKTLKGPISPAVTKALTGEFPTEAYKHVTQRGGYTTLQAGYITERLNQVFGIGRWKLEHETKSYPVTKATADGTAYIEMHIVTKGRIELLDYEIDTTIQYGGAILKSPVADSFKSSVTDCLSKAASHLGIGNSLFKGLIGADGKVKDKEPKEKKGKKTSKASEVQPKKEDIISPDTLLRIAKILIKDGGKTKELAKSILLEKYGIPHTIDMKKMSKKDGDKLLAKILNPGK